MNPLLLAIILATPLAVAVPLTRGRTPQAMVRVVVVSMAAAFTLALAIVAADMSSGDEAPAQAATSAVVAQTPAIEPADPAVAQPVSQATPDTSTDSGAAFIGAAIAVAASALGAGIAIAYAGSAALATISEQPDLFGRAMVVVGLAEGVAIYGLIVAVLILGNV